MRIIILLFITILIITLAIFHFKIRFRFEILWGEKDDDYIRFQIGNDVKKE